LEHAVDPGKSHGSSLDYKTKMALDATQIEFLKEDISNFMTKPVLIEAKAVLVALKDERTGKLFQNQRSLIINSALGGSNNNILSTCRSIISSSKCSNIYDDSHSSTILSNYCSRIHLLSDYSSLLSGSCNQIYCCSDHSSIISGQCNKLEISKRSVILGGCGLTLSNEDDVVFVSKLKIATASLCNTADMILVRDVDGYVRYRESSTICGTSLALPTDEIVFGTNTGVTSSLSFKFNSS
jgi:hypothetical protein